MKYAVITLTILILALIGKSIFGYSLILPFVLAFSFIMPAEVSFLIAFIAGVILSFINGSLVGRESLGLLLASGFIHLYERRFSAKHWIFYIVFAGLGSGVYSLVVGRHLTLLSVVLDILLMLVMLQLVRKLKEKYFSDAIILKI